MYTITKQLCLTLVCVLMFSSCAKDEITDESALKTADLVDYVSYTEMELEILTAVNNHRISLGLSELKRVDGITFLASDHNTYMIQKKEVSHDNFQKRYFALVNDIGAKAVSENVAFGYRTANAAVRAWLESEGHRKNIEGNYTHFGISVAQDDEGRNYFTNIFARR